MARQDASYSLTVDERYQHAQTLIQGIGNSSLIRNATVYPVWVEGSDCFWYERELKKGKEYRLVDATSATNILAFDHVRLAEKLTENTGKTIDPEQLPISHVAITLSPKKVNFTAFDKRWCFDADLCNCIQVDVAKVPGVISPDGRYAVHDRDYNLYLLDLKSGKERALTHDGSEDYCYGAVGSAWGGQVVASSTQLSWSPDSKRIFTVQRDTREVKTLPIVRHVPLDGTVRPKLTKVKVAFPGDEYIETLRLVVIDVESGQCIPAEYTQIPVIRNSHGFFADQLGWWAVDSQHAYFVDMVRGYQTVKVVELDALTGATRVLFEEKSSSHINLMLNQDEAPTFKAMPESRELLWFSERSGWAHLYLYDLETGVEKNPVTSGEWCVQDIAHIDTTRREAFIQTGGRHRDNIDLKSNYSDPYYADLARVHLDTGEITSLAVSDHDYVTVIATDLTVGFAQSLGRDIQHAQGVAPSGNFAVVTRSRADEVPISLVVDRKGSEVMALETADISELLSVTNQQWKWPEPVKLLADDGITDIYGLVFRPSDFSPERSYPVVSHVFNTPEVPWVSKGSFSNGIALGFSYFDAAALAELGFIVVQIEGRGTVGREKSFYEHSYGWAEAAGDIADHVAGIKQLAQRFPYMDLARVGISSHASGGHGGVLGLLHHPEFYKVGVNGCLHDSRLTSASMWGEKFEGLTGPQKGHKYPEELAENLQGKLLMMHSLEDNTCPVAGSFRVVDALQKANKDFDLIVQSNIGHNNSSYMIRRSWDFLVKHLSGDEPPKNFHLKTMFGS